MKNSTQLFKLVFIAILIITCNSCKKEDLITLNSTEKTLNYEDEFQIEAESNSLITYSVENEYHAEVSESGLVKARYVGETNIILQNAEDRKILKLIVEPRYHLYPEPNVYFGESRSSIISKFGWNFEETESAIAYENYSLSAPIIIFTFDDYDKLNGYAVMVNTAYSSTLADFLMERYLVAGIDNDVFYFINGLSTASATTAIMMELYNISYWMVLYIPYTSSNKILDMKKSCQKFEGSKLFNKLK